MFLILRLFNSVIFVVGNLSTAFYTLQRFFRVMQSHYELVSEVEEYNKLVNESRRSLEFVSSKAMEALREMESDIGKEVYITHNLTKLSSKIAGVTKRFDELEEGIIELARLSYNMENATVETPADINDEVRKILVTLKQRKSISAGGERPEKQQKPRSPRRAVSAQKQTRSHSAVETIDNNIKTPAQQQSSPIPISKTKTQQRQQQQPSLRARKTSPNRSSSPVVVPEVTLLAETRRKNNNVGKPIGFRPPWMCEV